MTTVRVTDNDGHITIQAEGHSGYGAAGADIVCAGVSVLIQSFNELCIQLEESDKIEINGFYVGNASSEIDINDPYGYTLHALQMLKIGLGGIAEQFPSNVEIVWGADDFRIV